MRTPRQHRLRDNINILPYFFLGFLSKKDAQNHNDRGFKVYYYLLLLLLLLFLMRLFFLNNAVDVCSTVVTFAVRDFNSTLSQTMQLTIADLVLGCAMHCSLHSLTADVSQRGATWRVTVNNSLRRRLQVCNLYLVHYVKP